MRTTLDIADDVLFAVKEKARRERRTAGEVISELARKGLQASTVAGEVAEGRSFYGFDPFPHRGPAVTRELVEALSEVVGD